jgi:hypothetical protein
MTGIRNIGILLHKAQATSRRNNSIVWAMQKAWESRGLRVHLLIGPCDVRSVDLLIPHLNLTVRPAEYQRCIDDHPLAVNRQVRDISKTVISQGLVRPGDGYKGPVIVKTNRNFGGRPETKLNRGRSLGPADVVRVWRRVWDRVRGGSARRDTLTVLSGAATLDPHEYPIFESVDEVPSDVFANPSLIVERFVPERDGGLYCLRSYVFFGARGYNYLKKSPHPIVKAARVVHREPAPVPDSILETRKRLGFDYGKFDYVIREGRAVLLDTNQTPTFAGKVVTGGQLERAAQLADGLAQWTENCGI